MFDPEGREVTFQGANDAHTPVAKAGSAPPSHTGCRDGREPYQPYHTHDDPQPLQAGTVYELDVEIWPTSIVTPKGYTLALTVEGRDYVYDPRLCPPPRIGFQAPASTTIQATGRRTYSGGTVTLYGGGQHASYVLVPIVPSGKA